MVKLDINLLT